MPRQITVSTTLIFPAVPIPSAMNAALMRSLAMPMAHTKVWYILYAKMSFAAGCAVTETKEGVEESI